MRIQNRSTAADRSIHKIGVRIGGSCWFINAQKRTPQTASRLGRYLTLAVGHFYLIAGKDFK